jgi:MarR-like DNA-binding transcriptional regulator SgrR of sgrS sRNA
MIISLDTSASAQVDPAPIRINVDSLPVTLEPPLVTDTVAGWVLLYLADRLLEMPSLGQLKGNIATSWKISPDRKTIRFVLRKDKTFSDGTPVSASSVAESLRTAVLQAKQSRIAYFLDNIASITAERDGILKIKLKRADSNLLEALSDPGFSIYRKRNNQLFFSGGFSLERSDDQSLEIVRKHDGQRFQFLRMPFDEAHSRFQAGQLEILKSYGLPHIEKAARASSRRVVTRFERTYFVAFNTRSTLFGSLPYRREAQRLLRRTEGDLSQPELGIALATSLMSPTLLNTSHNLANFDNARHNSPKNFGLSRPRVLLVLEHDLETMAKRLLESMNAEIVSLPKKEFLKEFEKGNYDMLFMGYGLGSRNWEYLSSILYSGSRHNFARVTNTEVDSLLLSAQSESKPSIQRKMIERVLRINEENAWYVPLVHAPLIFALSPRVVFGAKKLEGVVNIPDLDIPLREVSWHP